MVYYFTTTKVKGRGLGKLDIQTINVLVQEWSYCAIFVFFLIGLFLFPVPNEILLMTGGFLSTTSMLEPIPTYFTIIASVIAHGILLYGFGQWGGKPSLQKLKDTRLFVVRVEKGEAFLNRYGLWAVAFGYYLPFLRHATPFSVGLSNYRFHQFLVAAAPSQVIWSSVYFLIGYSFHESISYVGNFIETYGMIAVLALLLLITLLTLYKKRREKSKRLKTENEQSGIL